MPGYHYEESRETLTGRLRAQVAEEVAWLNEHHNQWRLRVKARRLDMQTSRTNEPGGKCCVLAQLAEYLYGVADWRPIAQGVRVQGGAPVFPPSFAVVGAEEWRIYNQLWMNELLDPTGETQ